MSDPGHHHVDLKQEVEKIKKEAEHIHNVRKHEHKEKEPAQPANPFPELEHQVETGAIEVVSADGKVTGKESDHIVQRP